MSHLSEFRGLHEKREAVEVKISETIRRGLQDGKIPSDVAGLQALLQDRANLTVNLVGQSDIAC